jgi:hypothetical protein
VIGRKDVGYFDRRTTLSALLDAVFRLLGRSRAEFSACLQQMADAGGAKWVKGLISATPGLL